MLNWLNSFWLLPLFVPLIIIIIVLIKKHKLFDWSPRIFAIFLIIIMMAMSLTSVSNEPTLWLKFKFFFSSNLGTSVPLFILLMVALKYELLGGIGFLLAGLFHIYNFGRSGVVFAVSIFIIGTLFLIHWYAKQNHSQLRNSSGSRRHRI